MEQESWGEIRNALEKKNLSLFEIHKFPVDSKGARGAQSLFNLSPFEVLNTHLSSVPPVSRVTRFPSWPAGSYVPQGEDFSDVKRIQATPRCSDGVTMWKTVPSLHSPPVESDFFRRQRSHPSRRLHLSPSHPYNHSKTFQVRLRAK